MVKIEITMTRKALSHYLFAHAYKNFSGILSLLISIAILVLGVRNIVLHGEATTSVLYIVVGVILLCHTPLTIFLSTKKQMREGFGKPITYILEEERLLVEAGGQQVEYDWKDLIRVTKQWGNVLVHSGYRNAFIWPLEELGDQYGPVIDMLKRVMGPEKVQIK